MGIRKLAAISAGAAIGAGARWAALELGGVDGVEVTILCLNVFGAFLLASIIHRRGRPPSAAMESLLTAGFCGSLTTWSSLALLTADHLDRGRPAEAAGWLTANLGIGLAAAVLGRWLQLRGPGPDDAHGVRPSTGLPDAGATS